MMEELPLQSDGKFNSNNTSLELKDGNSEAMKYLEQLLSEGRNEGISETELQLPVWYDAKFFKEGQGYIKKYRLYIATGFLIGFISSLSIPSILKILNCTRQSDSPKKAYRRYMGTILHTMSWYNQPLEPGSDLWESLSIVRSAHFRTSRTCLKLQFGQITQKDLVLTQFSLIGFFMLGADRMNLDDVKFLEATTYMWRVLGYLLGIKDKYNICGRSWKETKPRFEITMERVFRTSLLSVEPGFYKTTEVLLEGLRQVHMVLTLDATLFYIKRLAGCKGYEFLEDDFAENINDRSYHKYNSLGIWDRIVVSTAIFMFTYLYKYAFIRWYLNFFGWITELVMYYFPFLGIYRYGWDWAYVRIFSKIKDK